MRRRELSDRSVGGSNLIPRGKTLEVTLADLTLAVEAPGSSEFFFPNYSCAMYIPGNSTRTCAYQETVLAHVHTRKRYLLQVNALIDCSIPTNLTIQQKQNEAIPKYRAEYRENQGFQT